MPSFRVQCKRARAKRLDSLEAQRRPHEFSRIIVCAACRRRLRVMLPNGIPYYKDISKIRKLDCPIPESLSVKAANIIYQFGDILIPLEQDREAIVQAALSAGETPTDMTGYWSEATPEERRDIVGGLLTVEGLIYDLER